jgi:hypothetical protein
MAYTLADYPQLRASLLGEGGLWHMLRKDLLQQLEMPAHFDQAGRPDLGCAPNLSVMMIAMGGLETMATLAKIGGVVANGNATETVKRFADRYFQHVNPLYARPVGQSLIRLLWDAYRNGGLHRFFPKAGTVQIGGRQVDVRFGVSWYEVAVAGEKRSATLSEARAARASTPALTVLSIGPDSYNVWLVAQFFVLDFIDAVERWAGELTPAAPLGQWFVTGAGDVVDGLALKKHPESLACLADLLATATPVGLLGSGALGVSGVLGPGRP